MAAATISAEEALSREKERAAELLMQMPASSAEQRDAALEATNAAARAEADRLLLMLQMSEARGNERDSHARSARRSSPKAPPAYPPKPKLN